MASTQVTWQSLNWIGFLFWTFMNSYTGRFWLWFLCWVFIVPIVLFVFFWSIYNFGPEHLKWLRFDILTNPVPGIEFEGCDKESNDLNSFRRRCFNHNLIARCIARNRHLSAKWVTRSSTVIVHDCPLSNINESAPKLHGYETCATFHNTSMDQEVSASHQSMPMTLHFVILEFSCPDIVFLSLPRCPPDGLITSSLVLMLISSIFTIITTHICIQLSLQQIKRIQVTLSALRELFHMVLREAPTRFTWFWGSIFIMYLTLFHLVPLVHDWLDLQQFHHCLWLKSMPLQYHYLTQIHLFGYATTQQLVTSAMTSLFSLENLFLQFILLV